jgi:hypothetical protein
MEVHGYCDRYREDGLNLAFLCLMNLTTTDTDRGNYT